MDEPGPLTFSAQTLFHQVTSYDAISAQRERPLGIPRATAVVLNDKATTLRPSKNGTVWQRCVSCHLEIDLVPSSENPARNHLACKIHRESISDAEDRRLSRQPRSPELCSTLWRLFDMIPFRHTVVWSNRWDQISVPLEH